jgi:hypothetical protein
MSKYSGQFPSVYKITDYGQKIGNEANRLAYPNNPKVAQYPGGHATPQFKSTMSAVTQGFHFWNAWSKVGASCDVFSGTCIRSVYNREFPLGLWKQLKYMQGHADFVLIKDHSKLQDGDIILYKKDKLGNHGHICIHYKGKIKEASAKHYFGRTTNQLANRLSTKGKKYVYVFRVKDGKVYTPLKQGSRGEEVKKLQSYLNWYLGSKLKIDGDFGPVTNAKVKLMQNQMGLKIDGIVGTKTLAKMKEANK